MSRIDLHFAQAYWALRQQLALPARSQLHDEDLDFLNSVRRDCDVPEDGPVAGSLDCVAEHYKTQRERWASRLTGVAAEEANRAPEQHLALQRDLQATGFLSQTVTADGAYGDATRTAITAWQTARGRPATGFIGDDDAQALSSEVAALKVPGYPSGSADATPPAGAESIPLTNSNGVYELRVQINDAVTIPFLLDSGASEVVIPLDVFSTLRRTGTVSDSDFIGTGTYTLADGSQQESQRFLLHKVRVGKQVVGDVVANIVPMKGNPLLGQSFLSKLPAWSIDNAQHTLVFNHTSEPLAPPAVPSARPATEQPKQNPPDQTASSEMPPNPAVPQIALASLPCSKLLGAYGTPQMQSFSFITQDVMEMDKGRVLGSNANVDDYVLTECRLNEGFTVGEAVLALFSAARSNNLPAIPIGGASNDPRIGAEWQAYDNWLKHEGPQPKYAN